MLMFLGLCHVVISAAYWLSLYPNTFNSKLRLCPKWFKTSISAVLFSPLNSKFELFYCRVLKGAGSQSGVSVWQHTLGG